MTHKDYKYFKQQLKQGNKVTLLYSKIAPTGEYATTHSNFKTFKYDVRRLNKEGIKFTIRVERNKYVILQDIRDIISKIRETADLIGEDTIWHDYVEQLKDKIFELNFYI